MNTLKFTKLILVFFAMSIASMSMGAGFDDSYRAYLGDLDNDGKTDILIRKKVEIVLLHGEPIIPVVISTPDVDDLILRQTSSGSFELLTSLTALQNAIASTWTESAVDLVVGDFDLDGILDVLLKNLEDYIPGVFDQLIFAPSATDPTILSEIDTEFINYFTQAGEWLENTDYFVDNAPLKTITVPQTTGVGWYYFANTNAGLDNQLDNCAIDHGLNCGYHIGRLDEIFSDEVCEELFESGIYCDIYGGHVFGYTETTVLVTIQVPDYSVFEENAVITSEAIDTALQDPDCADESLNTIILNAGQVIGKTPKLNKENESCSTERGEGTKKPFVDTVAYLEYIRDTIGPETTGEQVILITTEPDWGRGDSWEAWTHVAQYASLQHPESPIKHYIVRRVSQVNEILMRHRNISHLYLIGHSGPNHIFVGDAPEPDTNISHIPGPKNVHPNTLDWSNLTEDAFIHIWGCRTALGDIADEIAVASGATVFAITTWINFNEDTGEPFKRWYRDGQWFEIHQPGDTPISCPAGVE